jgi:pyruvate formate lyase activating enzyme
MTLCGGTLKEKKPFLDALPRSLALSFGMLGCDSRCTYCHNWFTSQSLKDDSSTINSTSIFAKDICDRTKDAKVVVSTYNELLITNEWAVEVFKEAKQRELGTAYVSNGHRTPEMLEYIRPWINLIKIDLKSISLEKYNRIGGYLDCFTRNDMRI